MMSMMSEGGDDFGPEESTTDIQWAIINPQSQLNCLYQIMYYQTFMGAKKTPGNV